MSGFAGLNIARRALAAQLKGLEIAGQNIANVNTPGYSRQVATHTTVVIDGDTAAGPCEDVLSLSGVEVAEIKRHYDMFLDARVRTLTSESRATVARHDALARIEELLHEPGDATLGTAMEDMWSAFAQLTTSPLNEASRNNVLYRAATVAESFRTIAEDMTSLQNEVGERALRDVERVNALVQSLAGVNERLVSTSAAGTNLATPNALLDKRDELLRELAVFTDVQVSEQENGVIRVTLAGRTLLDGSLAVQAELVTQNNGNRSLVIAGRSVADDQVGGALGGELIAHNQDIPHYQGLINQCAHAMIQNMNTVHASGYDTAGQAGGIFYSGSGAQDIALSVHLQKDPGALAVSAAADGNDGVIAQRFADLRETPASDNVSITFRYGSLISELGSHAAAMKVVRDNTQTLVEFATARAEAVSGVSLDEELTDIMRYNQAYAAAARVMTSIDEALDVLINRTGHVGR